MDIMGCILDKWSTSTTLTLTVASAHSGKEFMVNMNPQLAAWICVGDSIMACCEKERESYTCLRPPLISPPSYHDGIVKFIQTSANALLSKTEHLLKRLLNEQPEGKQTVIGVDEYLSKLADKWMNTRDRTVFQALKPQLNATQAEKLLRAWYSNRSRRRLKLLGLQDEEIKNSGMPFHDLYTQLLVLPFAVLSVPLARCIQIAEILELEYNEIDIDASKIARKVQEICHERAWTSVPEEQIANLHGLNRLRNILKIEYGMHFEYDCAYLGSLYTIEKTASDAVRTRLQTVSVRSWTEHEEAYVERANLSADQKIALQGMFLSPISLVTGGPGTGKTTLIGHLRTLLEINSLPHHVCAFTGKAVSNMNERFKYNADSTKEATTIHRLKDFLNGFGKKDEASIFQASMRICRHIIIDEASTLSTKLFTELMSAVGKWGLPAITLVGDNFQLPPIEPGHLFSSLIKSEVVPRYHLTTNHRIILSESTKIENNTIYLGLNRVLANLLPDHTTDFVFVTTESEVDGVDAVVNTWKTLIKQHITASQIRIITPYTETRKQINRKIQELFDVGQQKYVNAKGKILLLGDKVIMRKNDYSIRVYNGTEGEITGIEEDHLLVRFRNGTFPFPYPIGKKKRGIEDRVRTTRWIQLSYCLTVDLAQGSEWEYVIGYLKHETASFFLHNLRMYTLFSRVRRRIYCVGNKESYERACKRKFEEPVDNLHLRVAK